MEVRERYYRTLDSTNNEAKKQAQTHCPEGTGHLRRAPDGGQRTPGS